jgi:hypothetical protein
MFSFPETYKSAAGPTPSTIQWVPGFFPRGTSGRGVNLTTHLNVVPRLRMSEATYTSSPPVCVYGIDRDNFTPLESTNKDSAMSAKTCRISKEIF